MVTRRILTNNLWILLKNRNGVPHPRISPYLSMVPMSLESRQIMLVQQLQAHNLTTCDYTSDPPTMKTFA